MLAFLGISTVDRFVVPQLILIDREGMIHYQTPPLGDEDSYKEDVIRKRVEMLLNASSAHRSRGPRRPVAASKRQAVHLEKQFASSTSARSSVWIERLPPEQKVRGSNPLGRTKSLN